MTDYSTSYEKAEETFVKAWDEKARRIAKIRGHKTVTDSDEAMALKMMNSFDVFLQWQIIFDQQNQHEKETA